MFLFQPPLNNIQLYCKGYMVGLVIDQTGGMTFGQLLKEMDRMRTMRDIFKGEPGNPIKLRHAAASARRFKNKSHGYWNAYTR